MKAIEVRQFGGPEVLQLREAEVGQPGAGQARVRLMAAGVNYVDIYHRRGSFPRPLPFTPGLEGAGVVEAAGDGDSHLKPGMRGAYTGQPGAYAESSLVQAGSLIPVPEELSWEQAASFPLQGMTAHYLIHEFRTLKPGVVVLIHAAAGGMGLLLVQWAHHLGARVIGTVS